MNKNSKFVIDNDNIFESTETAVHFVNSIELSLVRHLDASIKEAMNAKSKLKPEMAQYSVIAGPPVPDNEKLLGFSGYAFRHLMNNLCSLKNANYLEVGVFRGSTLICSVYGNEDTLGEVHAIDNYSEFVEGSQEHPKDSYNRFLDLYIPDTKEKIQFHEGDCFEFDVSTLPKIDIYFYDGDHSAEAQYKAFKHFEPAFADVFIAVVDDWEQRQVRRGTRQAFEEIGYDVVATRAIVPPVRAENANRVNNPTADWWCGTHLAVLKKRG